MKTKQGILFVLLGISFSGMTQDSTMRSKTMDSVTIITILNQNTVRPLPATQGTYLLTGKKTELIDLVQAPADITNKTGRQLFAKIPGVFVYDMDGAGNQVNVAARGLDPHRGWEFNMRKDGMVINSDMYGYPASHYSMPLESISRIEVIRGTGSLQYGAQFGGMINYVSKQGDTTCPINFESINTTGSFNLLSTYNAIGGKKGKFSYYAYMHKKTRNGYRDHEYTQSEAQAIILTYEPDSRVSIRAEWARSKYRYRVPGPLTDSMFYEDPRQATRSRNYFSPDIHVPSLSMNWQVSENSRLQFVISGVLGKRNSVLFDKPANIEDTINTTTNLHNNRQVDIDRFNSYTAELRWLQHYRPGKYTSTVAAGIQYMNNDLHRTQLGKGTNGDDYDLTLVSPGWGRDPHFKTTNVALFAENKFQLLRNLSITTGARIEAGKTNMSGSITYYPEHEIPVNISHRFPLFGVNISYHQKENIEWYAGWSQAYRPMVFKDIIPGSLFEKVDPDIEDAKGYNAELGVRGSWKFLRWDINGFLLRYNNRFGTLAETDNTGAFYTYRTNIGNSITRGIELLIQADWALTRSLWLSAFTSTAYMDGRYKNAVVKSGNANIDIDGNKIESVPEWVSRNGLSIRQRRLSVSYLYSYTSGTFADALNTYDPPKSTGAVGWVPAYGIFDIQAAFRFGTHLEIRGGINNLCNKQYFTKRPLFYPGPGVWSSDGRSVVASVIFRL